MLDTMELKFNQIKDLSEETSFTTKQLPVQVFRDLLTTINQYFNQYVKGKMNPFNGGKQC
eukprot:4510828-Ditylum_brightwellii.AAC.1